MDEVSIADEDEDLADFALDALEAFDEDFDEDLLELEKLEGMWRSEKESKMLGAGLAGAAS
jgi:hypothetical protein